MESTARLLDRQTLVLNRNWQAIQVTSVREAIGLVAKGSAFVLEPETYERHDLFSWADVSKTKVRVGDAVIRSPRLVILPPEVIVLSNYDGQGEKSVIFSRRNLFKRDRYTCQFCGVQPGPEALTIDHVLPKSRGGISSWENCVLSCMECNKRKSNRTPDEAGMKLRKIPKKPSWRILTQVPPQERRESWEAFLSKAYWSVELEP
jgi:5-methylcytosine-specific restriction endonuclease McrA